MVVVRICCSGDNISDGWEVRPRSKTQTQRIPMTSFANECVGTIFVNLLFFFSNKFVEIFMRVSQLNFSHVKYYILFIGKFTHCIYIQNHFSSSKH